MKLCYDIECNGLNPDTIWMIVAYNLDTETIYRFSDHDNLDGTISDGLSLLRNAELLVGHNIIGFDNRVLDNLFGESLNDKRIHDTFVMSQALRYKRNHRHGLAGWGEHLGNSKMHFDEWDKYSREMLRYCIQDVKVNVEVYRALLKEYADIYARNPLIKQGLKVEHDTAVFNARARDIGWNFDLGRALQSQKRMLERMNHIEGTIEPQLGERTIWIDKEEKTPKYKKNGDFTQATANSLSQYFDKPIKTTDVHVIQPSETYRRSRKEAITLGSLDLVKTWLLSNGWIPDEYQRKKIGWEWVTTGPKLTTTSLVKMGEVGEMIDEYYTLRNRHSVISGWIDNLEDNRIHGNMWTIGTPTFRARHEVIVNLPAVTASWGKELREVFIADEDSVIVGADSSGNQLRGLCHYVGNTDFTHEVCFGDQHQRNADILGCSRPVAKSYLYAYLFGAGDGKLGQVLTGKNNPTVGKQSKEKFARGIQGLQDLKNKLNKAWKNTFHGQGDGWFPALDGRPVFVSSEHQTLNYLLQAAEGLTCKAALSWAMEKIKEEGLRASPRLFYHDEQAWNVHKDDAERVGEILQESFKEAPKTLGVECMDGGDYIIGASYADVH